MIHFIRRTRAEEGAKALLAVEGNGHVARVPLDVVKSGDPGEWQGAMRAHLALASASARIKGLETDLGVALLKRRRRGIELTFDGSGNGLGTRSKRYAMLAEDGVVKALNIEGSPGVAEESTAEKLLASL